MDCDCYGHNRHSRTDHRPIAPFVTVLRRTGFIGCRWIERAGLSMRFQGWNHEVTVQNQTSQKLNDFVCSSKRRRVVTLLLLTIPVGTLGCRGVATPSAINPSVTTRDSATNDWQSKQVAPVQTVAFTSEEGSAGSGDDQMSLSDMLVDAAEDSRSDIEDILTGVPSIDEASPNVAELIADPLQPSGISLEAIEAMALANHPGIREQRAEVEAQRGQYVQAGLPYNPVFQYQADEIGNEDSTGLHTATLSQQLVTANKLGIARQVQAREIQKQQAQVRIAELTVLARVRASFATALVAQRRTKIANQIVDLAEQSVDSVQALLDAEEVSKIALLQAKVELQQAGISAENAETNFQAALKSLSAASGNPTHLQGPLTGNLESDLVERPWESLIGEIASISPEIARAGSELERAKWALQLACAQVVPNVTVQAGAGYDASSDDTFGVFGVSVPLPIRNRNQGNIRTARAEIASASAAIERTELDLQGRLAEAVGRYEVARRRYVRLTESVIPNARETYDLARQAFEAGETDYLQLLTAQRTLFDTQLTILDAIATAKQTAAEIDGLLVRLSF